MQSLVFVSEQRLDCPVRKFRMHIELKYNSSHTNWFKLLHMWLINVAQAICMSAAALLSDRGWEAFAC